jgi:trehalose utilization protein
MNTCDPIHVTVWNEDRHETLHDEVKQIYPRAELALQAPFASLTPTQVRLIAVYR